MWVYLLLLAIVTLLVKSLEKVKTRTIRLQFGGICHSIKLPAAGFIVAFIILGCVSAFRDGIGIDFEGYYHHIRLIQAGYPHYMEIGFKKLVTFVAHFSTNPRWVLIIMGLVTCFCYLKVFWEYSPDPTISIFLFLTWGYYFFTFNTIRGYFAQAIALLALSYLNKKKYVGFAIMLLIAALFHKTALICVPAYLLSQMDFKNKQRYALIIGIAIVLALLFRTPLQRIAFSIYPEYEGSAYDTGRISWLNILKAIAAVLIGSLYYSKVREDRMTLICFNLNVFSLIFYIGFYWTPEISRIGFYMNTTSVFFIPRLLSNMGSGRNKDIVTIILLLGSMALFFMLMRGFYNTRILLLPYRTWIGGTF